MQTIPVFGGATAIVDDADYEMLSQYTWHLHHGYVETMVRPVPGGKQVTLSMQRLILNPPAGLEGDHINRNKLDNRRSNLRICTHAENCRNRKRRSDNQSGKKGVYRYGDKWRAMIGVNGKLVDLGCFILLDDAANAYDQAAERHHGEFANTNADVVNQI